MVAVLGILIVVYGLYLCAYAFRTLERTVFMFYAIVITIKFQSALPVTGKEFLFSFFAPLVFEHIVYKILNCDILRNTLIKKIVVIAGGILEIFAIIYCIAFFNGYKIF